MIVTNTIFAAVFGTKKVPQWKQDFFTAMNWFKKKNMKNTLAKRVRKARNLHRRRGFAAEEMTYMKEKQPLLFRKMFRVDVDLFEELVASLTPTLKRIDTWAINSSGSSISVETRLAVTLRWLSGGSYLDLCFAWGISLSSFLVNVEFCGLRLKH